MSIKAVLLLINAFVVFSADPNCVVKYVDEKGVEIAAPIDQAQTPAAGVKGAATTPVADMNPTAASPKADSETPASSEAGYKPATNTGDVKADSIKPSPAAMNGGAMNDTKAPAADVKGAATMNNTVDDAMGGEYAPFDMEKCQFQAAMCVFYKKNPKLGGNKNTKVDANTKIRGSKGLDPLHAHGMAWSNSTTDLNNQLKKDVMDFISNTDHYKQRGYYGHLPGFPKCSCVESMPLVTRSDCTQIDPKFDPKKKGSNKFTACRGAGGKNNDLAARYKKINQGGATPMLDKYLKG